MDVLEAVRQRRSMKFFDPEHVMPEDDLRTIMESALLSPTAFNIQHWRFLNITDREIREEIKQAAWGQGQITDASTLLLLAYDKLAWQKSPARYWKNAPEPIQQSLLRNIHDFYAKDEQMQRDEGMRSCAIAAQTIMLVAQSLGYYSCPMDGFDFKRVGHLVRLPEDHEICLMICIGKATQEPWPRGGQLAMEEVFFTDRFPE
ncbi:MAG: nitroreductase family protein [Gammaproteobacteria bacterium]|nr:nitroreductase family protein [Gammaproteobacteria bacterium]